MFQYPPLRPPSSPSVPPPSNRLEAADINCSSATCRCQSRRLTNRACLDSGMRDFRRGDDGENGVEQISSIPTGRSARPTREPLPSPWGGANSQQQPSAQLETPEANGSRSPPDLLLSELGQNFSRAPQIRQMRQSEGIAGRNFRTRPVIHLEVDYHPSIA